jgi:hypothetical protein
MAFHHRIIPLVYKILINDKEVHQVAEKKNAFDKCVLQVGARLGQEVPWPTSR